MPTSTRWRLHLNDSNHGTYVAVTELTMSATAGGADLTTGGTATVSGAAGGSAADVFDNSTGTTWTGFLAGGPWVEYQFPSATTIAAYSVQCNSFQAKGWTFEYWDGSAWQVLDTVTNQINWYTNEIRSFPLVSKMQWRLHVTATAGGSTYAVLAEVQFRTVASGANQATVALQASADSTGPGTPGGANDGNSGTVWQSAGTAYPHWWMYWFAGSTSIVEYVIQASTAGNEAYAPKTWTLQYWDGTAWVVADTRTGAAAWTAGETRTFTVASATPVRVESFLWMPL